MASFQDKIIVITGASDGIGAELARQLASDGAKLVLAARSIDKLHAVAAQCEAQGAQTLAVQCDVNAPEQCHNLITQAVARFGGIDVLVNNAGVSMHALLAETPDTTVYERLFRVNVMSAVNCTQAALPHLKASKGLIVAVSSLAGKIGVPGRTAYAATKFAMYGVFESLRLELMPEGVAVCIAAPGVVATNIRHHGWNAKGETAGTSGLDESKMMSVAVCAAILKRGIAARKREVLFDARAKLAMWLKLIAPSRIDAMAMAALSKDRKQQLR